MAVAVQTEPTFTPGKAETLFQGKYMPSWDIAPDGKRFMMIKAGAAESDRINIVINWFEELKQRVPTGKK